jgi:hypothetical protein
MIIRQEIRNLAGSATCAGVWLLTWAKVGALPWSLVAMEAIEQ